MDIVKNQDSPAKHWIGWLCFTSHRQRGHLETAPPFGVPCEGHEDRFYTVPIGNQTAGRCMAVHKTTAAPRQLHYQTLEGRSVIGHYSSVPDVIASKVSQYEQPRSARIVPQSHLKRIESTRDVKSEGHRFQQSQYFSDSPLSRRTSEVQRARFILICKNIAR